ncbi:MAG: response regulator transcription factor [Bacteroidia bacterium]|nr:response regulator transcription factor [Bacteroidia bacterium]
MNADIRVAIVEDDEEILQLFSLLIENSPGFSCPYTFSNGKDAVENLRPGQVDVILMDIDLPGLSGISCTQLLREQAPNVNIVMLTVHEDDQALFDSLCAGATGYILKETPPSQILGHIQSAFEGGSPMSGSIARRVVKSFHAPRQNSPLSEREREVLGLLCKGQNYKMIAEALFVSPNTIKAHIKNIYRKLEVNTRAEAVSKAHKDRLL